MQYGRLDGLGEDDDFADQNMDVDEQAFGGVRQNNQIRPNVRPQPSATWARQPAADEDLNAAIQASLEQNFGHLTEEEQL